MTVPVMIEFQPHLSEPLRRMLGNADYQAWEQALMRIDEILVYGGLESKVVRQVV